MHSSSPLGSMRGRMFSKQRKSPFVLDDERAGGDLNHRMLAQSISDDSVPVHAAADFVTRSPSSSRSSVQNGHASRPSISIEPSLLPNCLHATRPNARKSSRRKS